MRPWNKGRRGEMKVYGCMRRKDYLMTSGTMEKVRKIVLLPGSMQKTFLKRAIATLVSSEAKAAIKLISRLSWPSLST